TVAMTASGYPGGEVPVEAGFALLVDVDGTRAEARAQRDEIVQLLSPAAIAIEQPPDRAALWRWRDGFNPVVTAVRGAKVSEDVVFPPERISEGLAGSQGIGERHGPRSCAWVHGGG